ncbi:serine hydrolase domain-containing protein [Aspergillus ibericus CBS 121593]|uniref:Beta-lactamase/transpeptidase-like protein n=1 Tax=Aspergillus ibericus CBS 121593 TaxID=1448316 RepID=A0A395GX31_9EURO|nr:beta-lactamase/transpeptidase-like protein [Aspergillus ibericus CBS 121593]RAK99972.1 beta-lactamase/transpeptidase-like protein [Aspergillus ibericus CBS 121593]
MALTHGHSDPAFSRVRDLLQQYLTSEEELGASICVNIDGRNVVDLWGGYADTARTKPWEEDTLTVVWSVSKVITAIAIHILIDRGLLDPNEKVAKYWPEFAANGKENILVSHILSHTSGVSSWELPNTIEDIYDVKKSTDKLATQAPWWTPGTQSGYHLVRRTSGKPLEDFIRDELAGPLAADYRLGVPEEDWPQTADMDPPPPLNLEGIDQQSIAFRTFVSILMPAEASMTPAFRQAKIGAMNGFSNARAVARIGSVVSLGGQVDGKQYLSPRTIDRMLEEQIAGTDLVSYQHLRFGLGVGLPVPQTLPWLPDGRIGFWCGWGGSTVIMDVERRMTIAYTMNKMGPGMLGTDRTAAYVRAIYEAVA